MKKFFILMFLMIFSLAFSQVTVERIRFNTSPSQVVLDISGAVVPKYNSFYDKGTRLLFLEVENSKLAKGVEASIEKNNGLINTVETTDLDGKSNFFIVFEEGVSYTISTLKSPTRIVINMKKEEVPKPIIVLDAGHGDQDSGAVNGSYREKDVNLAVTLLLGKELEKDFTIHYTRFDDTFISLGGRSEFSNSKKPVLFVSIHANANNNKAANGTEVFYFSKNPTTYAKQVADFENSVDKKFGIKESAIDFLVNDILYKQNQERSMRLSKLMVDDLAKVTGFRNRGIHGANFAVLRGSDVPAVLVELGFISNDDEVQKLFDTQMQEAMAKSLANAIRVYLK